MTPECHHQYYDEFPRTTLLPKRCICLEKVLEKLLEFHARLNATRWSCIDPDHCLESKQRVREVYINHRVVCVNPVIRIQRVNMHFGAMQINNLYGLSYMDMDDFESKSCDPGS